MSNVRHKRRELIKYQPMWNLIADCIEGEFAIKGKREKYLPKPNPTDTSAENKARYDAYLARAVFYGVTGRTLRGLVGQVFSRAATIETPDALETLVADAEGDGVSLEQQSKKALEHVISLGRAGLLADYPTTEQATTIAELESGEVRPVIKLYNPNQIINWRTRIVGAKVVLSMVVLLEYVDAEDDGFEITAREQYRVLRLDEETGNYTVQLFKDAALENPNGDEVQFEEGPVLTPTDATGNAFKEIPFTFIGSENNDHTIDLPPLFDMAIINRSHYRNSADYEESSYIVGQPTPWVSGLTNQWLKDVFGDKIELGSRAFLPLPENANAGLLQAQPNTVPFEAMQHKERQMVALGAKLVEDRNVQRTATEANQDEAAETSVLSSAAKNVSTAYQQALAWAYSFVSATAFNIVFELNSDFDLSKMSPQERQQLIAEWQAEAITYSELRSNLRRGGIATLTDDEAKDEIETNPPLTTAAQMVQDQIDNSNPDGQNSE